MPAFLLTWKPRSENKKRGWPLKDLQALAVRVAAEGEADEPWRVANRRDSRPGNRVFLIRQGRAGLALIGYGRIRAHRNPPDLPIITFERLVDPEAEVLAWATELRGIPNSAKYWRAQSSGTKLPDDVADALESLIRDDVNATDGQDEPSAHLGISEPEFQEGERRFRLHRRVERRRNSALIAEVKRLHGYKCAACAFEFSARYGQIGDQYIDAHHLVPLSRLKGDGPQRMDPKKDFAVLCANCHRMIHKLGCPTLADFRKILR